MSVLTKPKLSKRGGGSVAAILPKIKDAIERRLNPDSNLIDLSTAENWLIRSELVDLYKSSITQDLTPEHLSYSRGVTGDPDLLEAFASFFNENFKSYRPVLPAHIAIASGASSCIDALLYNICDLGDSVLVPAPYWNGFDIGLRARSSVVPIPVCTSSFDTVFKEELLTALETAIEGVSASNPVKALLLTNPHNPLGICYPKWLIEDILRFCSSHNIHLISDEVYAMSTFDNGETAESEPFVSVLSLDLEELGVNASSVHVVWSLSKDFGQSGIRMGCVVSQASQEIVIGVALTANIQVSSLSTICVTNLLKSSQLPALIALNCKRLAAAYCLLVTFFKEQTIQYIPCNAGLYVFARLAKDAKCWADEEATARALEEAGVLVSQGKPYHVPEGEKGWMRVGFSVPTPDLLEAIRRMRDVLSNAKVAQLELKVPTSRKRAAGMDEMSPPRKRVASSQ